MNRDTVPSTKRKSPLILPILERTLREFAARYGLSKDTVRRMEAGEQNVTIDTLEHLCKVFRCDIAELFPPLGD